MDDTHVKKELHPTGTEQAAGEELKIENLFTTVAVERERLMKRNNLLEDEITAVENLVGLWRSPPNDQLSLQSNVSISSSSDQESMSAEDSTATTIKHATTFGQMILQKLGDSKDLKALAAENVDAQALISTVRRLFAPELAAIQRHHSDCSKAVDIFVTLIFQHEKEMKDIVDAKAVIEKTSSTLNMRTQIDLMRAMYRPLGLDVECYKKPYYGTVYCKIYWLLIMLIMYHIKAYNDDESLKTTVTEFLRTYSPHAPHKTRFEKMKSENDFLKILTRFAGFVQVTIDLGLVMNKRGRVLELCGLCESGNRYITGSRKTFDTQIRDDLILTMTKTSVRKRDHSELNNSLDSSSSFVEPSSGFDSEAKKSCISNLIHVNVECKMDRNA